MGGGASKTATAGAEGETPSDSERTKAVKTLRKANTEARKLQLLISAIGKTHFHETVLACVKVEFLSHNKAKKIASGDYVLPCADCMQIVSESFEECIVPMEFRDPVRKRLLQRIPLSVNAVPVDDLMHVLGQAMCQYNSYLKAKSKFDELDNDNSGYLDGHELNKVVDWMLPHTLAHAPPLGLSLTHGPPLHLCTPQQGGGLDVAVYRGERRGTGRGPRRSSPSSLPHPTLSHVAGWTHPTTTPSDLAMVLTQLSPSPNALPRPHLSPTSLP